MQVMRNLSDWRVFAVDYCRFGGHGLQKPTIVWCSVDLGPWGFKDYRCLGKGQCMSLGLDGNHLSFYDNKDKKSRQHIPPQLIIQLANATGRYLNDKPPVAIAAAWKPLLLA